METVQLVITAMREDCFFGSEDISDAFYTIPVHLSDRHFFCFIFENVKYLNLTALVMEFAKSPLVFTKLLKAVFSNLRARG